MLASFVPRFMGRGFRGGCRSLVFLDVERWWFEVEVEEHEDEEEEEEDDERRRRRW